ncbi:MAG: phage tail protein [Chloroflexota bacterium]
MSITDFRFSVELDGRRIGAFTECTLPSLEWDVEQIREGGQNNFIHQLPKGRKSGKLTLKRGLGSSLIIMQWYLNCLRGQFERKDVTINLMGYLGGINYTAFSWTAIGAYPTKWSGPQLQSSGKAVAVETLELACNEIIVAYDPIYVNLSSFATRMQNAAAGVNMFRDRPITLIQTKYGQKTGSGFTAPSAGRPGGLLGSGGSSSSRGSSGTGSSGSNSSGGRSSSRTRRRR